MAVALCLPVMATGQAEAATSKSTAKAIATCKKNIKTINTRAAKIDKLSTAEGKRYTKVDASFAGYLAKSENAINLTKTQNAKGELVQIPELADVAAKLTDRTKNLEASIKAYNTAKKPYRDELDKQKTKTTANCSKSKDRAIVAAKFTKHKAYPSQLKPKRDAVFNLYKKKDVGVSDSIKNMFKERRIVTAAVKTYYDNNKAQQAASAADPDLGGAINGAFAAPPATDDTGSGGDGDGGDGGGED